MRRQVASSRGAKAGRPAGATKLVQALARKVLEPFVADPLLVNDSQGLQRAAGARTRKCVPGSPGERRRRGLPAQRTYVSITRAIARSQTRQNAFGLCVNMMQSSSGR